MELTNKVLQLVENQDGLAGSSTRMIFNGSRSPYEAAYSGPNVSNGHALVFERGDKLEMVYHALTVDGELVAGRAIVKLTSDNSDSLQMQLHWQWLTGDQSSGISSWTEVDS